MAEDTPPIATTVPSPEGTAYDRRADFLIAMYEQLMGDINRHIVVIWQMVGVLAASVAALILAEKNGIPTSYAVLLIIVVSLWVMEHVYDSNFWYNRNLVMITNIERVFLKNTDLSIIHPYFGKHRSKSSFLTHLKIQRNYTVAITVGAMAYFIFLSVVPTFDSQADIDILKLIPFLAFGYFWIRLWQLSRFYDRKYGEYLAISPGIQIDQHVDYGVTHGS